MDVGRHQEKWGSRRMVYSAGKRVTVRKTLYAAFSVRRSQNSLLATYGCVIQKKALY